MINTEPEEQESTQEESLKESVQRPRKPAVHEEWQWEERIWKGKNNKKTLTLYWECYIVHGKSSCSSYN